MRRLWAYVGVGALVIFLGVFVGTEYFAHEEMPRGRMTEREVWAFGADLQGWAIANDRLPGPGLADAVQALLASEIGEDVRRRCPMLVNNRDGWGRPFVYEVRAKEHKVFIRSVGGNGVDDNGNGDDIQADVLDPVLLGN